MKHFRIFHHSTVSLLFLGVVVALNYRAFDAPFYYDSTSLQDHNYLFASGDIWQVIGFFPQRPVAMASLYWNYLIAGLNPYYFRFLNAVLMAMTGLMAALIIDMLYETPALKTTADGKYKHVFAILLGLIFVVHPVQSFLVLYIWQRFALLSSLFFFAAFVFYLGARTNRINTILGYSLSLVLFVLAMAAKENAIIFPIVVVLAEIAFFNANLKRIFKTVAFAAAAMVLAACIMSVLQRPHGSGSQASGIIATVSRYYLESGLTLAQVLINQCRILFSYVALIFDPEQYRLQLITPQVLILSLGQSIGTVAAILAAMLMGIAGIVLLRLRPLTGFGILFFVLGLAPESVLVPQYLFVIYRASLPMFGLILVLADIVLVILQRTRDRQHGSIVRISAIACLSIIAAVLSGITYSKAEDWRDPVVFWKKAVEQLPPLGDRIEKEGTRQLLDWLGSCLVNAGKNTEALEYYNKSLTLNRRRDSTYALMANAYIGMGDFAQAEAAYRKALEINPNHAQSHVALAGLLSRRNQNSEAAGHYGKAVEINPTNPSYRYFLGVVLIRMGNHSDAVTNLRAAVRFNPRLTDAHYQLGKALLETGKPDEAYDEFRKTVALKPDHTAAHTDIGVLLATSGRIQEAVTHFGEALKTNPNDELARENLETALRQMRENPDRN